MPDDDKRKNSDEPTAGQFSRMPTRAANDRRLKLTHHRILLAITQSVDKHGSTPARYRPSMKVIAERTGMKRKNVPRPLSELVSWGYLRITRTIAKPGDRDRNGYQAIYGAGGVLPPEDTPVSCDGNRGVLPPEGRVLFPEMTPVSSGDMTPSTQPSMSAPESAISQPYGADRSQATMLRAIAGCKERESDEGESIAKGIVTIFPPERRGDVNASARAVLLLMSEGVEPEVLADAARSYVERLNKPRYCKSFLEWLKGEPWRPDWASVRNAGIDAFEAAAPSLAEERPSEEATMEWDEAKERRRRKYEASPQYRATRIEWPGKSEALAAFEDIYRDWRYRGAEDQARAYFLAVCFLGIATPGKIAALARAENGVLLVLPHWLRERFPVPVTTSESAT